MDKTPLSELPAYWQEHIRHLRTDRARLREGLDTSPEIRRLRKDCARYRVERNEARAELEALRAERA